MGGITRLKGMGRFMEVMGLWPVPIIPIWSWVWKYILDVRPVVKRSTGSFYFLFNYMVVCGAIFFHAYFLSTFNLFVMNYRSRHSTCPL